jgi:hypothetical protein
LDNLKGQGVIEHAVFAFYLTDDFNSLGPNPSSSLSFGSWDLEKYALSDLTYVTVYPSQGYWAVQLSAIGIGDTTLPVASYAVIDSGTSLIVVPLDIYEKMRAVICAAVICEFSFDLTVFSCENGEETHLPVLSFTIDGTEFPLPPQHYFLKENGVCYVLILPMDFPLYILGDPFMRAYYTVFDADNSRIGIARSLNHPSTPEGWLILVIIGCVILLLIAGTIGSCFLIKRRRATSTDLMEPLIRSRS